MIQNLTTLDALIADYVEETILPADLSDVTPEDRLDLDKFARKLRVTPAAALAISRASSRESVAWSRESAAIVANALAARTRV